MLSRITGVLVKLDDDEARVEVGPFEYTVMVPEAVRRQLHPYLSRELSLHISEYFEGNQGGTRFVPRKVGFLTERELEFFELFCTVDKVGVKKALKAMARPVRDIADAVSRQDTRWLSTLPGIGAATAEQMVATMRKKITPFLTSEPATPSADADPLAGQAPDPNAPPAKKPRGKKADAQPSGPSVDGKIIDDTYQALMVMGLNPAEARDMLDRVLTSGKPVASVDEALQMIFRK